MHIQSYKPISIVFSMPTTLKLSSPIGSANDKSRELTFMWSKGHADRETVCTMESNQQIESATMDPNRKYVVYDSTNQKVQISVPLEGVLCV